MNIHRWLGFDLNHVDTCSPDYWSGHHLPHLQIPVFKNMTLDDIKQALLSELNECVLGSLDYKIVESDLFHYLAKQSISDMTPNDKNQTLFFTDLDEQNEEECTIYAFFVLVPVNY